MSRMTFPMYMLAMSPQKISGRSSIICGPGSIPWMMRAESRIAVAGMEGIPRTRSGIIALPVVALLAVSGPATPSILPVPNASGSRESFRSTA